MAQHYQHGVTNSCADGILATGCSGDLIQEAREQVTLVYGPTRADPLFVCQSKPVLVLEVSHGTTRFAPLLPQIIFLGPQGQNADVAAHEYFHAELAMQVDQRPAYSREALQEYLEMPDVIPVGLSQLERPSGFYQDAVQGRMHYAFAKCVVGSWMGNPPIFNGVQP